MSFVDRDGKIQANKHVAARMSRHFKALATKLIGFSNELIEFQWQRLARC